MPSHIYLHGSVAPAAVVARERSRRGTRADFRLSSRARNAWTPRKSEPSSPLQKTGGSEGGLSPEERRRQVLARVAGVAPEEAEGVDLAVVTKAVASSDPEPALTAASSTDGITVVPHRCSAPEGAAFVAASRFMGARAGYVFKAGAWVRGYVHNLGYHLDRDHCPTCGADVSGKVVVAPARSSAEALLAMLHERINLPDASSLSKSDPLTPLAARMLLELAEEQPTRPYNNGAPILSEEELVATLADEERLLELCTQLTNTCIGQGEEACAAGKCSEAAADRLVELAERGVQLGHMRVRLNQSIGGLPVRVWDAPSAPPTVLRLPASASAKELWERGVLPHVPCVISGAFDSLCAHCTPESLARLYGHHLVKARREFIPERAATEGYHVFVDNPSDDDRVDFGRWCRDAAAGKPSAREVYPAKLPLRDTLPEFADHLDARDDTPLAKYGACVGAAADKGVYMYAGAGANTTQTHFDPAENFLVVARGSKRLQLLAPGEVQRLYPTPNPSYHSTDVPAFTEPGDASDAHAAYRDAQPVTVDLHEGDMLYLPAYWYHGVYGGDGFNVLLAWWSAIHPNKRDDATTAAFEPVRPQYTEVFLGGNDEYD
jgi:hypothetical protein